MVLRLKERLKNHKTCNVLLQTKTKNAVKCSHGNAEGDKHRRLKWVVCDWCYKNNIQFATEATFQKNQRADIVILDWAICIEILSSETKEEFLKKSYPLPTIPVKCSDEVSWVLDMLNDLANTDGKEAGFYIRKFLYQNE